VKKQTLILVAAVALIAAPSAESKVRFSLTVEPSRPVAKQVVRVTMRAGAELPEKHGLRLFTVGPWRDRYGQSTFEVRVVRTGPSKLRATVRFPHAGRWQVFVPNWGGRIVKVLPST
jgi:hypothetical protein